jgi:plastocyanin
LLFPFGVTFGAAAVIVTVVFSLSRVLLALEQESSSMAATVVAMAGASAVLLGAVWSVARRRAGSRPVLAVLFGAGVMLVAAGSVSQAMLGGGAAAGEVAHGGSAAGDRPPPVTITAFDLGFKEAEVTSAAGDVDIRYANEGELDHTLVFEGAPGGLKLETPGGGTASGSINLAPGTYAYFCDLPGHRVAGMEGSLTVR